MNSEVLGSNPSHFLFYTIHLLVIAILMQSHVAINNHGRWTLLSIKYRKVIIKEWSDSTAKILTCGPWMENIQKLFRLLILKKSEYPSFDFKYALPVKQILENFN